jgi:hypothetical protein
MNITKKAMSLGLSQDQARRVAVMVGTAGLPFEEAIASVTKGAEAAVSAMPITSPAIVLPPPPGVEVRQYRGKWDYQADAAKRMAAGWRLGAQSEGTKHVAGWATRHVITVTWIRD